MKKIPILIADDLEVDRRVVKDSFKRLAPEFKVSEHSQGATLLDHLVKLKEIPRLLLLDRAFKYGQKEINADCLEAIGLAQRIRKEHPELEPMAILVYSRFSTEEEAAQFSDRYKLTGIWSRKKGLSHERLVDHVRHILSLWPT